MSLVNVNTQTVPIEVDKALILRALKLDHRDPKTQALLLICERYNLDPLLKHMVLIEGNPFVTRDGYLHIAHSSGQLDGLEVVEEGEDELQWWARVTVWRKDASHPFTYKGRFPKGGRTGKGHDYGPEMAVKCATSMALRHAFDVTGVGAADELHSSPTPSWTDEGAGQDQRAVINELSAGLTDEQKAEARKWVDDHHISLTAMTFAEADQVVAMLHDLVGETPNPLAEQPPDAGGGVPAAPPPAVEEHFPGATPVETIGGPPMGAKQNRQLMALATEVLVPPDEVPGHEKETWRRDALLAMADRLGWPGLTSRTQIGSDLADALIFELQAGQA